MGDALKSARVGLVAIAALIATIALFRYVDDRTSAADGYTVHADFEDVQGLIERSRVVIAGIQVGYIERIELAGENARVHMRIRPDIELHEDGAVAIRAVSLLGEKILAINPGSISEPVLEDGAELRVAGEPVGTDEILQNVNAITEDVREVTAQLARSFGTDEAGDRFESALRDLSESLATVNRTLQRNESVINSTLTNVEGITADARPRFRDILANVEAVTATARRVIEGNEEDLDRGIGEVDDTIASIHRATEELEGVLQNVHEVTERTAAGEGTIGRLTTDEVLIDDIETAAQGASAILGGFGRLRTILALRSEYNLLANTLKTYFSLRLAPREGRYFFIQLIDDPRGSQRVTQTLVRTSPAVPPQPGEYQETRITRSESPRFTVQLAKRVSFATFRFGIMESTGGLGLDLNAFRDRFETNIDIFAFGRQAYPRIRVRVGYEIVDRFFVIAGADDFLNQNYDFFLGLQLRFDDNDLRSIIGAVGAVSGAL